MKKKLPIGIQSFSDLRENGYLYVDKTESIFEMINSGKNYFLSRPRRFGKSLLVSTLDALFRGEAHLFKGLFIYDRWEWTQQYPVIKIDWTQINHSTPDKMESSLCRYLNTIASSYQITLQEGTAIDCFRELIELLHGKIGKKTVILIDEYDKPITSHLSDSQLYAIRIALHDLYQVMKGADEHIRFIFLTGVSKFSGLSIFSALNNPNDITLNRKYVSICGYTQDELENYFTEYVDEAVLLTGMSRSDLLDKIRIWYNGYSWDGKTSIYNPFSLLLFFENGKFDDYWFCTGTPAFLINLLKTHNQISPVLKPVIVDTPETK
jgi:hypothetical protein